VRRSCFFYINACRRAQSHAVSRLVRPRNGLTPSCSRSADPISRAHPPAGSSHDACLGLHVYGPPVWGRSYWSFKRVNFTASQICSPVGQALRRSGFGFTSISLGTPIQQVSRPRILRLRGASRRFRHSRRPVEVFHPLGQLSRRHRLCWRVAGSCDPFVHCDPHRHVHSVRKRMRQRQHRQPLLFNYATDIGRPLLPARITCRHTRTIAAGNRFGNQTGAACTCRQHRLADRTFLDTASRIVGTRR